MNTNALNVESSVATDSQVYTQWDRTTGRIISVGLGQFHEGLPPLYADARKMWGVQLDPLTQWIDPLTEEVRPRPVMQLSVDKTMIVSDGADIATITGIPSGTVLRVSCAGFVVDDGMLEFSSPHPGTHTLRFDAFPYQDTEVLIHAA
ncbi:hypothetical protein [Azospirillum brasilense]|uniref:hypothetical protein n=1 Tax=Azospirillum brasilense TaxID=192 RepID=UPI001EDC8B95|nr:hypothetical protein [Azospirillum brasilense]UKJ76609.1 hypothetical protein H1Q64_22980 [Azospirillum brasilense]